jgi:hypothetical protein
MVKVKFLISPIGRFNLAYFEGQEAELSSEFAQELVDLGYAEIIEVPKIEQPKIETMVSKPKTEKKVIK